MTRKNWGLRNPCGELFLARREICWIGLDVMDVNALYIDEFGV